MPGPSTTAVHGGESPDPRHGAVNTPVAHSTTYRYPEAADGGAASHIYTRYDNPTVEAVEAKLAALEGADGAFLFASGMAAIHATVTALLPGGGIVAHQAGIYGGTTALFHDELASAGYAFHVLDPVNPDIPEGTDLVWMESITNPLLRVADVEAWANAAHAAGARLVVDATFATPLLQRPLDLGADAVVHSATKYLNGHSDVTAGAVCFRSQDRNALWTRRRNLGATLDPAAGNLLGRGMKTLAVRMERHVANAACIAQFLADDDRVAAVHFTGLPDHPDCETALRVLSASGGMVTFDLGSLEAAQAFRRALRVVVPAASLGGVESLVSLPRETSHAYASADERRAAGVTDGLVRLSVGIEDADDLIADIDQALGS